MRSLLAAVFAFALVAGGVCTVNAQSADVDAVVARARQRVEAADFRATGRLVRVGVDGKRTSYPITIKARWFPGVLRVLCEIHAGSGGGGAARVHVLLEMHANGQSSIQIAHPGDKTPSALPFAQWSDGPLGSGYSYEDLLEAQYFWPEQMLLKHTKYGARDCDVLKSTPGPADRTHYSEVQSWLDHSIGYPVYVEKTVKATGLVKEITFLGLRQNEGVWSASQIEEKVRGQGGSTLLIIERGSPKANLKVSDFSSEQLTRF